MMAICVPFVLCSLRAVLQSTIGWTLGNGIVRQTLCSLDSVASTLFSSNYIEGRRESI